VTLKTNPNTAKSLLESNIPHRVLVKLQASGLWPSTFGPVSSRVWRCVARQIVPLVSKAVKSFETRGTICLATQRHTLEDWNLQPDSRSPGKRNPTRYGTWYSFLFPRARHRIVSLGSCKPVDVISRYFFKIHFNVTHLFLFDTNKQRSCGLVGNTSASS